MDSTLEHSEKRHWLPQTNSVPVLPAVSLLPDHYIGQHYAPELNWQNATFNLSSFTDYRGHISDGNAEPLRKRRRVQLSDTATTQSQYTHRPWLEPRIELAERLLLTYQSTHCLQYPDQFFMDSCQGWNFPAFFQCFGGDYVNDGYDNVESMPSSEKWAPNLYSLEEMISSADVWHSNGLHSANPRTHLPYFPPYSDQEADSGLFEPASHDLVVPALENSIVAPGLGMEMGDLMPIQTSLASIAPASTESHRLALELVQERCKFDTPMANRHITSPAGGTQSAHSAHHHHHHHHQHQNSPEPEGQRLQEAIHFRGWADQDGGSTRSNPRANKRGKFTDPGLRRETADTRRQGCCMRCRRLKIRCEKNPDSVDLPCLKCQKRSGSNVLELQLPCLRWKLIEIVLNKSGPVPGFEWTKRWPGNIPGPIMVWDKSEIKEILVADRHHLVPLKLHVRQFLPQEGDKLERTWDYLGIRRSVSIPPYALISLDEGIRAYVTNISHQAIAASFSTLLEPSDGFIHKTYRRAYDTMLANQHTEAGRLLELTFKLWITIRLSTTSYFIVGQETLGMSPTILDETSSDHGKIPMPPVLGAQLDSILIHVFQMRIRKQLLNMLHCMVLEKPVTNWPIVYLVSFILLHNTALITAHDAMYAKKHGMKRRFARVDRVKEYCHGANIILAHFHDYNNGMSPFSDQTSFKSMKAMYKSLDSSEWRAIMETRESIQAHKLQWNQIRVAREYGNDFFFVSQLFDEKWSPQDFSA